MKLREKLPRFIVLTLAFILVATNFAGIYTALRPYPVEAAGVDPRNMTLNDYGGGLLGDSKPTPVNCYAQINGPLSYSHFVGTADGSKTGPIVTPTDPNDDRKSLINAPLDTASGTPDSVKPEFKDIEQGGSYITITLNSDDSQSSLICGGALVLFQSYDSLTHFVGFLVTGVKTDFKTAGSSFYTVNKVSYAFVSADVNKTAGTVTISSPIDQKDMKLNPQPWDPSKLSDPGAVHVGANTCPDGKFSKAQTGDQTQACIDKYAGSAAYTDFDTISFAGATFKLVQWNGHSANSPPCNSGITNGLCYVLKTAPSGDPTWGSGTKPYLVLNSDPGKPYSGGDSKSARLTIEAGKLDAFKTDLDGISGGGAWLSFYNVDVNNHVINKNSKGDQLYVDVGSGPLVDGGIGTLVGQSTYGVNVVGTYYPKTQSIVTVMDAGNGGGEEVPYTGTYSLDKGSGKYISQSNRATLCSSPTTRPSFSNFIPGGKTGDLQQATWNMADEYSTDCSATAVTVYVRMAAADATPPENSPPIAGPTGCKDGSSDCAKDGQGDACESSNFSLAWIACAIINNLADAVQNIYHGVIAPMLDISHTEQQIQPGSSLYKAWSSFRNIGDIVLVLALLVIVFGEAIGGGAIDAYTVKRALPRILIAAILINLSYYVVLLVIDVTDVIGQGIGNLITAPFHLKTDGSYHFILPNSNTADLSSGVVTAGLGTAAVAAVFTAMHAGLGAFISFLFFSILLPVLFLFVGIMATLVIRVALIFALLIFSPIAFAAWTMPNTEQYFKKWWDLLLETSLMYPIISLLFALSVIMAQIDLFASNDNIGTGVLGYFISLILLALPLVMIPFVFKIASGTIGKIHEFAQGGMGKVGEMGLIKRRREASQERMENYHAARFQAGQDKRLQKRQDRYAALMKAGSKGGAIRRRAFGLAASAVGGYNVEAETSSTRARVGKELNDIIATGKDNEIRGLTVNKATSQSRMKDGRKQYKSLGGAWIDEAEVDAAHKRWGNNTFAQQTALSYEMRKASTEEEVQGIALNYANVARGWGMTDQQAGGAWQGAAFEHQNDHLEYKYTDWKTGAIEGDNATKFVNEVYEKKGSYAMSQNGSNTIKALQDVYASSSDIDTRQKIAGIAETFTHDIGAGSTMVTPTEGENVRVETTPGMGGARGRQTSTQGAAHIAERANELAHMTGVIQAEPTGQYTSPRENPQGDGGPGNVRYPGPIGDRRNQKS